jgi:3-oxoacyl-[acyl-carrier protein] reductase
MPDFAARTIAVSGGATGFGRAIAEAFREAGARVFACDVREPELTALQASGIIARHVDLTDRAAARDWIARVEDETGGPVDVLVNNAGGVAGQAHQAFDAVSDADWDNVLAINLGAAFALSQACMAGMIRAGRGAIVNIGSGASLRASMTGVQAYCAAKHALLGLTRQLAHELGPHGIRVNAVAPGFVVTGGATAHQWASYGEAGQQAVIERIALRRLGTPEDIAGVVLFLASDSAGFVNGEILAVDGGR